MCVHAHSIRVHPHYCTLASIHKSKALSSHELIATFEYFTLTKEAAIQKNLPKNWFGTCQWTRRIFWTPSTTRSCPARWFKMLLDVGEVRFIDWTIPTNSLFTKKVSCVLESNNLWKVLRKLQSLLLIITQILNLYRKLSFVTLFWKCMQNKQWATSYLARSRSHLTCLIWWDFKII